MIYGNIKDLSHYLFLEPRVLKCLEYARDHDLAPLEKGRHDICGDAMYFNVAQYTTGPSDEKMYEAHKAYIDIHYMIQGEEAIEIAFVSNMEQGVYQPEGDYLPVAGTAAASAVLRPGDFLICYPEDGHKPGVQVDGPVTLKKAIFKAAVESNS